MNKWVKRALIAGGTVIAAQQGYQYLKKSEAVQKRMDDLKQVKEYNDLRKALLEVVDAFQGGNTARISQNGTSNADTASQFANTESRTNNASYEKTNTVSSTSQHGEEETIADAVKRVLDTPVVAQLFNDEKDIEMVKSLVDETKQVEQLVRSWFK